MACLPSNPRPCAPASKRPTIDIASEDAERGQRGFLITGREVYLDPYSQAQKILPQLMLDLQEATQGSIDQQQRLLKLQADVALIDHAPIVV